MSTKKITVKEKDKVSPSDNIETPHSESRKRPSTSISRFKTKKTEFSASSLTSRRSDEPAPSRRAESSFNSSRQPFKTPKIEIKSRNYVGFKSASGIKSTVDVDNFKKVMVSKNYGEQARSVLQNLDDEISKIPVNKYASLEPEGKYEILEKLTDAYNYAWNDACMQLRDISEEHAKVFAKLKIFYMSLVDKYPDLIRDYGLKLSNIADESNRKTQQINLMQQEMNAQEQKIEIAKKYIIDIQNEANRIKGRKNYYKELVNSSSIQIEHCGNTITDLRLQLQKAKEEMEKFKSVPASGYLSNSQEEFKVSEKVDVGTDVIKEIEQKLNNQYIPMMSSQPNFNFLDESFKKPKRQRLFKVESVDRIIDLTPINDSDDRYIPLRHTLFSFIDSTIREPNPIHVKGVDGEYQRFYWIFPKVCSILINSMSFEDTANPYNSFADVLNQYLNKLYKTSLLTQQKEASLIQTAHFMGNQNTCIALFNKFIDGDYDFPTYRFCASIIEFSIIYSTPDISDIVANEFITPEEAVINILPSDALKVHHAVFPFWQPCEELKTSSPIDYWTFLDILNQDFIKARTHVLAFIKHGLLLSGCTDLLHITYKNFTQFVAVAFPDKERNSLKQEWKELVIQYKALGKPEGDTIDVDCIIYYCLSTDKFIMTMMKTNTLKLFTQAYFDWNTSMLNVLYFIVTRLTLYIPSLISLIPSHRDEISEAANEIRNSLFMADLSSAIGFYRKLLHTIDADAVNDFTTVAVSNHTPADEVTALLEHMTAREKIVGITDGK